jgi:hypothetical protein
MARWEDRNAQRGSLSVVASNGRLRVEQLLICTDGGPFCSDQAHLAGHYRGSEDL